MTNYQLITEGFQILRTSMAPYIARSLIRVYGDDDWWREGVWNRLYDYQRRNIPETGEFGELVDSLDIAVCLLLLDINWRNMFNNQLSRDCLTWVKELRSARNNWAHFGGQQPSARDAWRTLDTMSRLCCEIDQDAVAEIEALISNIRFEHVISPEIDDEPVDDFEKTEETPFRPLREGPRRLLAKRDWTADALHEVVNEWCEDKGRVTLKGFGDLGFIDAAEASLAMPVLGDSENDSFRKAADNTVFQLDDAKMMAITRPKDDGISDMDMADGIECSESQSDGSEPDGNIGDAVSSSQEQSDAGDRFEYLPKQKASWERDAILELMQSWASSHVRFLPAQVKRWHLTTLADAVLSKFPGQSDPATGFSDSQSETLFAPDARKLRIMTHM